MDSATASFYQFFERLFMIASKNLTKNISLNDIIVWCKKLQSSKICQTVAVFPFRSLPKHFFILSMLKFHLVLKNIPHKEKSIKPEKRLCQGKSTQKIHECCL